MMAWHNSKRLFFVIATTNTENVRLNVLTSLFILISCVEITDFLRTQISVLENHIYYTVRSVKI